MIQSIIGYNYQNTSSIKSRQIHFLGYTNEMMLAMRKMNNIPEYVNAAYKGFTGPKDFNFPTSPNLEKHLYPNITEALESFKNETLQEIKEVNKGFLGFVKTLKLFLKNFPTGGPWDTKFLPQFPGRELNGKTQYGMYKDKIVSANYVSNNLYAQICAAAGLSLPFTKLAAKVDACGILEVITKKKLPNKELIKFKDSKCDQLAISSGFQDFHTNNPWIKDIDPTMPHPTNE